MVVKEYNKFCRLCLCRKETLVSVFEINNYIKDYIHNFFMVKITSDDQFSVKICKPCFQFILVIIRRRVKYRENDSLLHDCYKSSNQQVDETLATNSVYKTRSERRRILEFYNNNNQPKKIGNDIFNRKNKTKRTIEDNDRTYYPKCNRQETRRRNTKKFNCSNSTKRRENSSDIHKGQYEDSKSTGTSVCSNNGSNYQTQSSYETPFEFVSLIEEKDISNQENFSMLDAEETNHYDWSDLEEELVPDNTQKSYSSHEKDDLDPVPSTSNGQKTSTQSIEDGKTSNKKVHPISLLDKNEVLTIQDRNSVQYYKKINNESVTHKILSKLNKFSTNVPDLNCYEKLPNTDTFERRPMKTYSKLKTIEDSTQQDQKTRCYVPKPIINISAPKSSEPSCVLLTENIQKYKTIENKLTVNNSDPFEALNIGKERTLSDKEATILEDDTSQGLNGAISEIMHHHTSTSFVEEDRTSNEKVSIPLVADTSQLSEKANSVLIDHGYIRTEKDKTLSGKEMINFEVEDILQGSNEANCEELEHITLFIEEDGTFSKKDDTPFDIENSRDSNRPNCEMIDHTYVFMKKNRTFSEKVFTPFVVDTAHGLQEIDQTISILEEDSSFNEKEVTTVEKNNSLGSKETNCELKDNTSPTLSSKIFEENIDNTILIDNLHELGTTNSEITDKSDPILSSLTSKPNCDMSDKSVLLKTLNTFDASNCGESTDDIVVMDSSEFTFNELVNEVLPIDISLVPAKTVCDVKNNTFPINSSQILDENYCQSRDKTVSVETTQICDKHSVSPACSEVHCESRNKTILTYKSQMCDAVIKTVPVIQEEILKDKKVITNNDSSKLQSSKATHQTVPSLQERIENKTVQVEATPICDRNSEITNETVSLLTSPTLKEVICEKNIKTMPIDKSRISDTNCEIICEFLTADTSQIPDASDKTHEEIMVTDIYTLQSLDAYQTATPLLENIKDKPANATQTCDTRTEFINETISICTSPTFNEENSELRTKTISIDQSRISHADRGIIDDVLPADTSQVPDTFDKIVPIVHKKTLNNEKTTINDVHTLQPSVTSINNSSESVITVSQIPEATDQTVLSLQKEILNQKEITFNNTNTTYLSQISEGNSQSKQKTVPVDSSQTSDGNSELTTKTVPIHISPSCSEIYCQSDNEMISINKSRISDNDCEILDESLPVDNSLLSDTVETDVPVIQEDILNQEEIIISDDEILEPSVTSTDNPGESLDKGEPILIPKIRPINIEKLLSSERLKSSMVNNPELEDKALPVIKQAQCHQASTSRQFVSNMCEPESIKLLVTKPKTTNTVGAGHRWAVKNSQLYRINTSQCLAVSELNNKQIPKFRINKRNEVCTLIKKCNLFSTPQLINSTNSKYLIKNTVNSQGIPQTEITTNCVETTSPFLELSRNLNKKGIKRYRNSKIKRLEKPKPGESTTSLIIIVRDDPSKPQTGVRQNLLEKPSDTNVTKTNLNAKEANNADLHIAETPVSDSNDNREDENTFAPKEFCIKLADDDLILEEGEKEDDISYKFTSIKNTQIDGRIDTSNESGVEKEKIDSINLNNEGDEDITNIAEANTGENDKLEKEEYYLVNIESIEEKEINKCEKNNISFGELKNTLKKKISDKISTKNFDLEEHNTVERKRILVSTYENVSESENELKKESFKTKIANNKKEDSKENAIHLPNDDDFSNNEENDRKRRTTSSETSSSKKIRQNSPQTNQLREDNDTQVYYRKYIHPSVLKIFKKDTYVKIPINFWWCNFDATVDVNRNPKSWPRYKDSKKQSLKYKHIKKNNKYDVKLKKIYDKTSDPILYSYYEKEIVNTEKRMDKNEQITKMCFVDLSKDNLLVDSYIKNYAGSSKAKSVDKNEKLTTNILLDYNKVKEKLETNAGLEKNIAYVDLYSDVKTKRRKTKPIQRFGKVLSFQQCPLNIKENESSHYIEEASVESTTSLKTSKYCEIIDIAHDVKTNRRQTQPTQRFGAVVDYDQKDHIMINDDVQNCSKIYNFDHDRPDLSNYHNIEIINESKEEMKKRYNHLNDLSTKRDTKKFKTYE